MYLIDSRGAPRINLEQKSSVVVAIRNRVGRNLGRKKVRQISIFDTQWSWIHAYDCDEEEHRRTVPLGRFWLTWVGVWQWLLSRKLRFKPRPNSRWCSIEHCHSAFSLPFSSNISSNRLHLEILTRRATCIRQPERWYDLDADRCSLSTTNPFSFCPQLPTQLSPLKLLKCETCGKCDFQIIKPAAPTKSFNPTFASDFIFCKSATWYVHDFSRWLNVHDEEPVSNSNSYSQVI